MYSVEMLWGQKLKESQAEEIHCVTKVSRWKRSSYQVFFVAIGHYSGEIMKRYQRLVFES